MFKKLILTLSLVSILLPLSNTPKAEASGKALGITALALGAGALGIASYDHFHRGRQQPRYWHGHRYW
jgi:hypothetical protein